VSVQLGFRHLGLYAGCLFTIAATTVIASVQLVLAASFDDPDRVRIGYLSRDEVASQLTSIRALLWMMSGLAVVIAGFLMFSSIRQVVSLRQRELALMRLAGANRWQLSAMVFGESVSLALVAGVPAALLGNLLTRPAFAGFQELGLFGKSVDVAIGYQPVPLLAVAGGVALTAGVAGFLAARSGTRGDLVAAMNPVLRRLRASQVAWRGLLVAASLAAIAFLGPENAGSSVVLLVPLLAVVPLTALAPVIVPACARLVGRLFASVAPGSAMLAAQRAHVDRFRFVTMATPMVLAIGLLGGFLVANAPDEQMRADAYRQRLAATAVASVTDATAADQVAAVAREQSDSVARLTSVNRAVSGTLHTLYFADSAAFAHLFTQSVTAGDPANVHGASAATSLAGAALGDSYTVLAADGSSVQLAVVAVLDDPIYEGVFLDWAQLRRFVARPESLSAQVFAGDVGAPALATELANSSIDATVTDAAGFIEQRLEIRRANTSRSNLSVFGTIYLMSLISVAQTAISSHLARRREYGVLRLLGIGRGGVVRVVVVESTILLAVAGVLVFAALAILAVRFTQNLMAATDAIGAALPQTLTAFGAIGAILLTTNAIGALFGTAGSASNRGAL
jgi:putative ABC transport system permease protein